MPGVVCMMFETLQDFLMHVYTVMLYLQESCNTLVSLLGREPAYASLSRAPKILLSVTPVQAQDNFSALQVCERTCEFPNLVNI